MLLTRRLSRGEGMVGEWNFWADNKGFLTVWDGWSGLVWIMNVSAWWGSWWDTTCWLHVEQYGTFELTILSWKDAQIVDVCYLGETTMISNILQRCFMQWVSYGWFDTLILFEDEEVVVGSKVHWNTTFHCLWWILWWSCSVVHCEIEHQFFYWIRWIVEEHGTKRLGPGLIFCSSCLNDLF